MVYKNAKLFMCILLNGKIPESYKRRAAMSEYILAVDIGTSNVKCMIARPDMTVLAEADSEYETLCTGAGRYEQDPELWWRHMILALQAAAAKASVRTGEIGRIAVSSQAPTMLPVDAAGRPLGNALIWMDRRSDAQCIDMGRRIGDGTVYRITGNKADPFYVYSELLWFKQNQPALYEKTRWILQANGYLNLRLTGSFTLDATHASITQCYDVLHRCWSSELLQPYGVPAELFPPVSQPVDVIGTVTQEAAAQTGLRAGTEVLAGSVDGAAAALEGGVTADGVAVEMSGTSSVLLVGSDRPHTSPNLTYMYSVVPEQHLLLGCMSTTGGVLKWYRDTFCDRADPAIYKKLDAQILAQCPEPSPLIFLPYLAGERAPIWDTNAKGVLAGITCATTQAEIIRAAEEGAAFALMDNITEARASGAQLRTLRAVGGSVNSRIWMQIKASVAGMPIEIPASCHGAPGGMLAVLSCAEGEFASIREAAANLVRIRETVDPVAAWIPVYQEKFELFRSTYRHLKPDFPSLHQAGGN